MQIRSHGWLVTIRTEKMGSWGSCRAECSEQGWVGRRPDQSQPGHQPASPRQEMSGQLGLCLPTELRENAFPEPQGLRRVSLMGAQSPHPAELLFGAIRRCWVGEGYTVCQGLGFSVLESSSKFRKEGRGRDAALWIALVPCLQALLVLALRCLLPDSRPRPPRSGPAETWGLVSKQPCSCSALGSVGNTQLDSTLSIYLDLLRVRAMLPGTLLEPSFQFCPPIEGGWAGVCLCL